MSASTDIVPDTKSLMLEIGIKCFHILNVHPVDGLFELIFHIFTDILNAQYMAWYNFPVSILCKYPERRWSMSNILILADGLLDDMRLTHAYSGDTAV